MKTLQREAGIKNPFAQPKQRIRNANRQEQKRGLAALKRQIAKDQAESGQPSAPRLHLVPTAFKSMFQ